MDKPLVLLLDDDLGILEGVPLLLEPEFDVELASTVKEAVEKIRSAERNIDIAVVDMWLGDDDEGGLKAIQKIKALRIPPEIIVLTAYGSIENAGKCMESGAFSYVEKTGVANEFKMPLINTIHRALAARELNISPATEAIILVDIVESTKKSNIFGWSAVGRPLLLDLRSSIRSGDTRGLRCIKGTGDGYLLTYGDPEKYDSEIGVIEAVKFAFDLLNRLADRNKNVPQKELKLNVRIAIHFGQVEVIESHQERSDRVGPQVTLAFRMEGIDRSAVEPSESSRPKMNPKDFPSENYILCSRRVAQIIKERCSSLAVTPLVGEFMFKGFDEWHEVYLIQKADNSQP